VEKIVIKNVGRKLVSKTYPSILAENIVDGVVVLEGGALELEGWYQVNFNVIVAPPTK
jgi:hypothetical protein